MRALTSLQSLIAGLLISGFSNADSSVDEYRHAQQIVVVTDYEGIHYAPGCAFYELRDLIASNVGNLVIPASATGPDLYEIRVLGKFGEKVVYVGDHQIKSVEGTVFVPTDAYGRIVELIEMRRGSGVSTAKVDLSVKSPCANTRSRVR